jgi:glycosyltransferase involved in cell wall biosynthesis
MNVLHLHSGNLYGGVETCLLTMAREAAHAPIMRSQFAVCFDGRFSQALRDLGCAPQELGAVRLSRPQSVRRARAALRDLLRRAPVDVVVCQQTWSCVVFGSVVREMGLPLVLWVHMASDGGHWLERAVRLTPPDAVVCNSRFSASRVAGWLPKAPRHVAYCPVSIPGPTSAEARRQTRQDLGVTDDRMIVGMAARAEEWKGHRVLIEALGQLKDRAGWVCWIAGGAQRPAEAAYMESLIRLVREHGLDDRVRLLGARNDVNELIAASDVYCQPNLEPEPFGLSLIEAMYAGLPVVTTAAGGALEIVDDTCGELTPLGNVPAVAAAIDRLAADPSRRDSLGTAGRHRARALCAPDLQMPHIERVLASAARTRPVSMDGAHAG